MFIMPKFSNVLLVSFSIAVIILAGKSIQAINLSTVGTTTGRFGIGNTEGFNQGEFFAVGRFWV